MKFNFSRKLAWAFFLSATVFAATSSNDSDFILSVKSDSLFCDAVLGSDAHRSVLPYFDPSRPELSGSIEATHVKHKIGRAFSFSPNGLYVVVRHDIFPDAEQLSLRSVADGELKSTLFWKGSGGRHFDISSLVIDEASLNVHAVARDTFTHLKDGMFRWAAAQNPLVKLVQLESSLPENFTPLNSPTELYTWLTPLSAEHPYYCRDEVISIPDSPTGEGRSVQIIDWRSRKVVDVVNASTRSRTVLRDPFNASYHYVAALGDDEKTIFLYGFLDVEALMDSNENENREELDPSTSTTLFSNLNPLAWVYRRKTETVSLSSSSGSALVLGKDPKTIKLVHEKAVLQTALSHRFPQLITRNQDGLFFWDVETGRLLDHIENQEIGEFRLFDAQGLVAYQAGNEIHIYGLERHQQVVAFDDATAPRLQGGISPTNTQGLFVELRDGRLLEIKKTLAGFAKVNTGIQLASNANKTLKIDIQTPGIRYFIVVSLFFGSRPNDQKMQLTVYQFPSHGETVHGPVFRELFPFSGQQFQLDPLREFLFYTRSDTQTGIINLKAFIEENILTQHRERDEN